MKLKGVDFKILEYLAFWEGGMTAGRISEICGIERVHAQRAIVNPYQRAHPGNLVQCGRARQLSESIMPAFGPDNLVELFETVDMIRAACGEGRIGVPMERLDWLAPRSGEGAFRALYAACARREAVGVSLDGPEGSRTGLFSPHHLVRECGGLHFRGHLSSLRAGRYVDVDPNRIARVDLSSKAEYVGPEGDADWHERETVTLRLAEGLAPSVRAAALREYAGHAGVEEGRLIIEGVRRCLVPHLVRHLRYRALEEGPVEIWVPDSRSEEGLRKTI